MQYTYLGRTGVKVSRLCLGCMSYGDRAVAALGLRRTGRHALLPQGHRGRDQFLRYGRHVLRRRQRGDYRARRCGSTPSWSKSSSPRRSSIAWAKGRTWQGLSRKHIQQGCEASLRRLGVETIDLYQIHRVDARYAGGRDAFRARPVWFAKARSATLEPVPWLRGSSPRLFRFPRRNGWARFVSMQNHYNLIYREEEREMMPLCQSRGNCCDSLVAGGSWPPGGHRKTPDDKIGHHKVIQ